jgi:hypothetical protein
MLPQTFDGKALMQFAQSDKVNEMRETFGDYFITFADNPAYPDIEQAQGELRKFMQDTPEAWKAFREYEKATGWHLALYEDAAFALGFWLALHPDAIIDTITPFWDSVQLLNEVRAEASANATC